MDLFKDKKAEPMLLNESKPFDSQDYIYELKLDGIRCLAYIDKKSVTLRNKRNKDVTSLYPELCDMNLCVSKKCILDGELVILKNGKPNFFELQKRSLMTDNFKIQLSAKSNPVFFVAYDILYIGQKQITHFPLMKRKKTLTNNLKEGHQLMISRYIEEKGKSFFKKVKKENLEGIVAKKKDGKYYMGKRCDEWIKIKVLQEEDLWIIGYELNEQNQIKNLVFGQQNNSKNQWIYRGKVAIGISDSLKQMILKTSKKHLNITSIFPQYQNIIWLKPYLQGKVSYMQLTKNQTMRQPVFKELVDDFPLKK